MGRSCESLTVFTALINPIKIRSISDWGFV